MRRRRVVLAVLAAILAFGGASTVASKRFLGPSPPLATNSQHPAPALIASDDPARGEIRFATDDQAVDRLTLDVVLDPPAGATEVQVGFDPTFESAQWVPVAERLTVEAPATGYQMLFGRFREGQGGEPSPISVDGIEIDLTRAAATASADDGEHRASWVRPLAPDVLVVRVEEGRIDRGGVVDYDFDDRPEGDEVSDWFGIRRARVSRDGEPLGIRVGDDDRLRVYDRMIGQPVDRGRLVDGSWAISGSDDPAFGGGSAPRQVFVVSRALGNGLGADEARITPLVHDVILHLDAPLTTGVTYTIEPPAGLVGPIDFTWEPTSTISPAVHVNQNGYGPTDPVKIGFVSGFPTSVGGVATTYGDGTTFRIIDDETGTEVLTGSTEQRQVPDEHDGIDLTGAPVFAFDFSELVTEGRYQACVDGVGCSQPFTIDGRAWRGLVTTVARALYHQRSGIALGPPYTTIGRPRPYHPEDGLVVLESDFSLIDAIGIPQGDAFDQLTAERTSVVVGDAWGGHFDAGDWDRRSDHLDLARVAIELVDRHPEHFDGLVLQIPESGNNLPDLLDEGLWTLDLFRRLQRQDGAISGGIEASEHPQPGTTSWTDRLAVFTYAPDVLSSYRYAGVAAQAAVVVDRYDPTLAEDYLRSAIAAMTWADERGSTTDGADQAFVDGHRSVAAVALYRATGDPRWHEAFLASTTLEDGVDRFLSCHEHTRCEAGWLYLQLDPSDTDPELQAMIVESFIGTGEEILAAAERTAFGFSLENPGVPLIWGLGVGGAPKAVGLLRAYDLTGDDRFLGAALRSSAVSLGANPTNTVYITGVGRTPVRHPLIVDTLEGHLPVWPGTPVYGNHRLGIGDDGWVDEFVLGPAGVEPLPSEMPYLWQWADVEDVPMYNEFTVHQSHAVALYVFGELAAQS